MEHGTGDPMTDPQDPEKMALPDLRALCNRLLGDLWECRRVLALSECWCGAMKSGGPCLRCDTLATTIDPRKHTSEVQP
jgi:hypothetical protein